MGYELLWLECLGFNLLLVALVTACSARLARRGWQVTWPAAVAALFLLNGAGVVAFSILARAHRMVFPWLGYFLSLELLSLAGSVLILWRGLRRTGEGEALPAARSWPRSRLGLAALIALALSFMTFQDLDSAVQSELSALRAEAGALAVSVAPPAVPDAANAALVYEQAFEALPGADSLPPQWKDRPARWQKAPEAHLEDADFGDYLRRHEPALKLFRAAAALPGCRFDRNFAHPSAGMLLPELVKMRQGARLLEAGARVRIKRGDLAGAAGDIAALRSMARHMRSDPILISMMVAMAIDGMADTTVERWLAGGELRTAEQLEALRPAGAASLRRDLVRAFRMEEATGLATFADLSSGAINLQSFSSAEGTGDLGVSAVLNREGLGAWRVFFLRGELASYRWYMDRVQSLAAYPYHESRARWAAFESENRQPTGILTGLLLPALTRTAENAARAEARSRLADLAVAAERHRLKHGRYPGKLDELASDPAALAISDPFDGQPLRMVQADGGVVLYSVGPDGKDDGGREYDNKTKLGDITFCLGAACKARRAAEENRP